MAPNTRGRPAQNPARAAARMKMLILELLPAAGSLSEVARHLGLSRSYIVKLHTGGPDGRTTIGQRAIDTVCERLSISDEYFTQDDEPGSYLDFVGGAVATPRDPADWRREQLHLEASRAKRDVLPVDWIFGRGTVNAAETLASNPHPRWSTGVELSDADSAEIARYFLSRLAKSPLFQVGTTLLAEAQEHSGATVTEAATRIAESIVSVTEVLRASPLVAQLERAELNVTPTIHNASISRSHTVDK